MRNHIFTCLLLGMTPWLVSAQQPVEKTATDLDFTIELVEQDYPGFDVKVTDLTRPAYNHMKDSLRTVVMRGANAADAAGYYLTWFGDMHLRLGGYQGPSAPGAKKMKSYIGECDYAPSNVACNVDDSTYLIRLTSCDGDFIPWVEQSVEAYHKSNCPNLIIDIRDNGGGNDLTYQSLLGLLYTHESMIDGVLFYATPRHLAQVKERVEEVMDEPDAGEFIQNYLKGLYEAMKQRPGELVLYPVEAQSIKFDTVYTKLRKAAIIIDSGVASSGEQFVLDAKACSGKVTVYGRDNSLGCLDFSNVMPTTLPKDQRSVYCPVSRSSRVPDRGIDEMGIVPDVRITLPMPAVLKNNVDEWTIWVAEDLKKR